MLLGPLFRFELVRLARRGTHLPLRVVLAVLLFVGLIASYLQLFPGSDVFALLSGDAADPSRLDKFGETFLLAFLVIQQVAVLLLTPVYAGGAIAEEKEKGRLDFLLTAPLSRWELVMGKLAARLVFVLAVVAVGLPVLSFTLLFGGVDPGRVLAGFVVAVVSAVSVGAFSVMLSVLRPTLRDVLLWAFGGLIASTLGVLILGCFIPNGVGGILSPATVLVTLFRVWEQNHPPGTDPTWRLVGAYAAIQLVVGMGCVLVAVLNVRPAVIHQPAPLLVTIGPDTPEELPPLPPVTPSEPPPPDWYRVPERTVFSADEIPSAAEGRGFLVPALGDIEDPLAWKERHFAARLPLFTGQWFAVLRGCLLAAFLGALGIGLFVGLVAVVQNGSGWHYLTNGAARVVLLVSTLVLPFAGIRAAVSVAEERAKKTLDSLFALPVDRSAILRAKAWAAVGPARWWALGAGAAAVLAFVSGGLNVFALLALALLYYGYAAFTVGVGVLLGVWCKTGVRAVLTHVAVTLVTFTGPFLLAPFTHDSVLALSPPAGVVMGAAVTSESGGVSNAEGCALCLSLPIGVGYAWAGVMAWRLAVRRFEQE